MSRSKPRLHRSALSTLLAIGLCLAAWALLATAPTAPVLAAEVKGQLVLGRLQAAARAKPPRAAYNWELENGVKEVLPTRVSAAREIAVVLVGPGETKAGDRLEIALSGGALLPSTLVLRSGTTLRIRNDDEIGHDVFAEGLDGFSAEATSPGATRSVHLVKTGNWPLRDRLAAHAGGHLHVLANLIANAKLEASGGFAFSDIAAGKYTLKVFRGAAEIASKEIEVADRPLALDPLVLGETKGSP